MSENLASDGAIEAVKIELIEAIRRGPDLGKFLRGGTFASCVRIYRNLSSRHDFDAAYFMPKIKAQDQKSNRRTKTATQSFQYPNGFCFAFQRRGSCSRDNCVFKHTCSNCEDERHGADQCLRIGSARKYEKPEKRSADSEAKSRSF